MNDSQQLSPRHLLYALVGAALLAVMGFLVAASGLIVPPWASAVLIAVWLAAVVMAVRSWRRKMFGPLIWGLAVVGFWYLFVLYGEFALGWSA